MHALILGSKEYPMGTSDGADSPSGGMEIYVQGLCDALSKMGVDVTLITRKFSGTKSREKIKQVEVIRVPFISGFYLRNPSFNLASFIRSLTLNFDIIISNGEVANLFGLVLSKLKRKPIIMVSHGLASEQPQYGRAIRSAFGMIDNLTYRNADAVVTHAPWQMDKITKKFSTVMPGLNRIRLKKPNKNELSSLRKKYAGHGEKIILYTGRLIGVKGIDYLIRSLKHIENKYVCIIVGDGPDMKKLKTLAKSENANVVFTGFRDDVARFLSIADVFVLPSFSESLNYSLVEAAYLEVPIVCSNIGVVAGDSAILFKPGDEMALSSAINKALSSKNERMLSNAKKYASTFDWDKSADSYLKVMGRLVK